MKIWIHNVLFSRWWMTLFWMALSGALFGLMSYNLFTTLRADLLLVRDNGAMALKDGVAIQLFEWAITAVLNLFAYLVFKSCEVSLTGRLTGRLSGRSATIFNANSSST